MSRLVWDEVGVRYYGTGVDHVTLYTFNTETNQYNTGVAFNGVSSIEESPSGAEATPIYADNIKYLNLISKEDFGLTLNAYWSPSEFDACDGTASPAGLSAVRIGQQTRKQFGLVYRTNVGNDTEGNDYGYAYHICYNLRASVSSKTHNTINDSPEAEQLSWTITSTDTPVSGFKPTSKITIYTRDLTEQQLTDLEDTLFGSATKEPTLPLPDQLLRILRGETNP